MKTGAKIGWKKLIVSILICQFAGVFGSLFTYPEITTWYASLNKPAFTPPNWLFGPAWTILFTLMGVSLYLVWRKDAEAAVKRKALYVFALQLGLNALWSFLFFGLHSPLFGLAGILLMLASILATILLFYRIDRKAAYVLLPYICWVSFAALLNYSVWVLN
jgi:tryptophan-rich sensory protein